jgi:hypothetical protein
MAFSPAFLRLALCPGSNDMKVDNRTPFAVAWLVVLDKNGAEHLVTIVKATYSISGDSKLTLAAKPDPIRPADEFHGEPGLSSIRYEAELGPAKVATNAVLIGSAIAPKPDTRMMEVSFRVGPLHKRAKVFGERSWQGILWSSASSPKPFDRIPLTYENAFGGKDVSPKDSKHHGQEPRNPVGRGFFAKNSQLKRSGMLLPNIEGENGVPSGFGFIGRDWQPRLSYAGTYDDKWKNERMPLLPEDFDERYHNAAHPDLVAPGFLKGNETVEVSGCTRSGRLVFALPNVQPAAQATFEDGREPIALNLNTVLVDTDAMKLNLVWKGDINVHKRLMQFTRLECRI